MRLLLLVIVGAIGAGFSAWGLARDGHGRRQQFGLVVGIAALVAITIAAFLLRPARLSSAGEVLTGIFDAHLVVTGYLRLVVGLWGLQALVMVLLAWLLGGPARLRGLLPAMLASITGGALTLASADLMVGAAAGAVTGLGGLFVILVSDRPAAVAASARELRMSLVSGAMLLVALAIVPVAARLALFAADSGTGPSLLGASATAAPVIGLATVAVGLAMGARWGLVPFHVRVSRLADLVPPEALPLLLAWTALPLTVVALAIVDQTIAPLAIPLDGERTVLVVLAVTTLVAASLAASVHDDLRHVVGYLVIADAGMVLVAIAALDPGAWGPGRVWVVVLAASKTALGAWAAVMEDRFETRSVPDLRGWVRRSPLLAAGLIVTTVATFGLPGWLAFEARRSLSSLVVGAPWDLGVMLIGFLTLPVYVRLLVNGMGRLTSRVDGAAPERFARGRRASEMLPVEVEGGVAGRPGPGPDRGGKAPGRHELGTAARSVGRRFTDIMRRNRTELLSAAVLTLAILAALASWGALDLGHAAAEPAPILSRLRGE